jgi:hypothetical protein
LKVFIKTGIIICINNELLLVLKMSDDQSITSEIDDNEHPYIKEVNITSDKLIISFLDGEEIEARREVSPNLEVKNLKTKFNFASEDYVGPSEPVY